MKVSSKARSAVQAMVQLARLSHEESFIPLTNLIQEDGLSLVFLEQIFLKLKKADLVISQRGLNGGYKLSKSAVDITILDIIESVEPIKKIVKCAGMKGGCRPDKAKCSTHDLWKSIDILTRNHLASVTLADVAFKENLKERVA
jgi:Rrf2 family iron-sulfur cluster assembly transcriptional regulator